MIIILYYYICRRSVYGRVCVRVCAYVHANVGLCADECVYTSVQARGKAGSGWSADHPEC